MRSIVLVQQGKMGSVARSVVVVQIFMPHPVNPEGHTILRYTCAELRRGWLFRRRLRLVDVRVAVAINRTPQNTKGQWATVREGDLEMWLPQSAGLAVRRDAAPEWWDAPPRA